MKFELNDRVVYALRQTRKSVRDTSARISARFEEAEETGDYSDADEFAADDREALHGEFLSLLDLFAEEIPELFKEEL